MKTVSSPSRVLVLALAGACLISSAAVMASPQDDTDTTHSTLQHVGNALDHAAITTQIKAALLADSRTKAFDTNVETDGNGRVTLNGTAPSAESRRAAGEVARNVNGVISVHNALVVTADRTDNPQTLSSKAEVVGHDGWLTTKVKAALADDDRVSSMDVTVESTGSSVKLSGTVPNDTARQAAIERTRQVKGVDSIDANDLVVEPQKQ
jgi:hyperosmotically inducible protein